MKPSLRVTEWAIVTSLLALASAAIKTNAVDIVLCQNFQERNCRSWRYEKKSDSRTAQSATLSCSWFKGLNLSVHGGSTNSGHNSWSETTSIGPSSRRRTMCENLWSVPTVSEEEEEEDTFFTVQSTRIAEQESTLEGSSGSALDPSLPTYPEDSSPPSSGGDSLSNLIGQTRKPPVSNVLADSELQPEVLTGHPPQTPMQHEEEIQGDSGVELFPQSPVVYRFFGRSRVRTHRSESFPFLLLGPSVDHWKSVGLILAARGFDVMACERLEGGSEEVINAEAQTVNDNSDYENLVVSVLDTLRWSHAILVGCDKESALAIEAALRLAPERVAGLVLCGNLSSASEVVHGWASSEWPTHGLNDIRPFSIDSYLQSHLNCPFVVVWDGDIPPALRRAPTSVEENLEANRCLILGGGMAPHRRVPEQFAWALTRFVEEKVASQVGLSFPPSHSDQAGQERLRVAPTDRKVRIPFQTYFAEVFSPSTFLVAGRVVAEAIVFVTAVRILVFQYDNMQNGLVSLKARYKTLASWRKHVFEAVLLCVQNCGSLFRGRPREEVDNSIPEEVEAEEEADREYVDDVPENDEDERKLQVDYLDRVVV